MKPDYVVLLSTNTPREQKQNPHNPQIRLVPSEISSGIWVFTGQYY